MESSPEFLLRPISFFSRVLFLSEAEETEAHTHTPDWLRIFLNPSNHRAYPGSGNSRNNHAFIRSPVVLFTQQTFVHRMTGQVVLAEEERGLSRVFTLQEPVLVQAWFGNK